MRRNRWLLFGVLVAGLGAFEVLCPNWILADVVGFTNLTDEHARRLVGADRDLGRHWVFSPPPGEPGHEVLYDWTGPVAWGLAVAIVLAALWFTGALRARRGRSASGTSAGG